jgi:hypothetical protein
MSGEIRKQAAIKLFILSFVTLFLEMMIIRWAPASVRLIAYYGNLMLISSFLGIGIGTLLKRRGLHLFAWFPLLLLVDVAFLVLCRQLTMPTLPGEHQFFSAPPGLVNFAVLIGVFALNTLLFVPLGERVGELFDALPPLRAYAMDLGGSLIGTTAFGVFSFLSFSPILGFVVVLVLYWTLEVPRRPSLAASLMALSLVGVAHSIPSTAIWSPYHIVTIRDDVSGRAVRPEEVPSDIATMLDPPGYVVSVNQDFYQPHSTIDPRRYSAGTERRSWAEDWLDRATIPYRLKPRPERVLIVGAGGGKDVEAALLSGAEQIDAVEIDPVLVRIAQRINAARPYDDPRVRLRVTDARAFFNTTRSSYDVVVFAFLDSQALFSSLSSIRLDGFVYTVESLRSAYGLLREGGLLSLSFQADRRWLSEKLVRMVEAATHESPLVYVADGQVSILAAKGRTLSGPQAFGKFQRVEVDRGASAEATALPVATDDWPFLYLRNRAIPGHYLVAIGALVLFSLLALGAVQRGGADRLDRQQLHFFLLGAAFLLMETKSIADCSLYFGATWFVTTVVTAGILLMVLLANLAAQALGTIRLWFYLPLLAALLVQLIVPREWVLAWSFEARLLWVLVFIPLPVFFAGLVFSTTFARAAVPSACLGANLIGATLGGFVEYGSMLVGYRVLHLVVCAFYLGSLLVVKRVVDRSPTGSGAA